MNNRHKIVPPIYLLVAVLLMAGLNYSAPLHTILTPPITCLGIGLIIVGLLIVIWPAASFGKAGTPIKPFEESTHQVTSGMYRVTRNPMYLGMVVILLGVAVRFGTESPFLLAPIFVWIIRTNFVKFEENLLKETFGDDYVAYKKRVRRWL
jgi:protein-S-isoprenylcysteine O-methyltransferase Ste14